MHLMRLLGSIREYYVRLSAEKLKIEAFVIHQEKKLKEQLHNAHHGRKRPIPPKHPPHNASDSEYKKGKNGV